MTKESKQKIKELHDFEPLTQTYTHGTKKNL